LSSQWTGQTLFYIIKPQLPPGMKWVEGRPTQIQKTTRPDSVWPEVWKNLSPNLRKKEIALWETEGTQRAEMRAKYGVPTEIENDDKEYNKIISQAVKDFGVPSAPAMLLKQVGLAQGQPGARGHQDHISEAGFVSDEGFALVHTPIPMPKAMQIPDAKQAVDKEWLKLVTKRAWLLETVQPRAKVKRSRS